MQVEERIKKQLKDHAVVLYMKGTPEVPQCGFSARALQILKSSGIKKFKTYNVLEDDELREGIKKYGDWPTLPQLYVRGELVGGSDILKELYENGELKNILNED
ncbi:MAG: Grx4 family monothiol glutaredoxin [Gammaproteobacteria bacterium]